MDQFVQLLSPNLAIINQIFTDLGRPDNVDSTESTDNAENTD